MSYVALWASTQDETQQAIVERFLALAQKMKDEGVDTEKIAEALEASSAFLYLCVKQDKR